MQQSVKRLLLRSGPAIAFLLVYLVFALLAPDSFSTIRNIETIARQSAIVGTVALGVTLVIIVGGVDLSIGSLVALSTVIIASLLQAGVPPLESVLLSLFALAAFGAIQGTIITKLKVTPFIVTLGGLLIARGLAKGLAHEQKIDAPLSGLNEILATLPPNRTWMIFPPGVWITLLLAILVWALLHYTVLGRHIFAIGSNERTARLCGIKVGKVKILVYIMSAFFAGIGGIFQFSRLTVGDPTVAVGLELEAIAAVVIGGGSLAGGEGSVVGTIFGALIMTTIRSGCSQLGLSNWIQEIVTGLIILLAVVIDRLRHRK